jgi:glycosyltransferase involved in cell wall biosynthesis
LKGRPVGKAFVPVVDGRISPEGLRVSLQKAAGWPLWECWLRDFLEYEVHTPVQSLPSSTVAVCTRDRPEDLQRCLDALIRLPDNGQELLIVDNCPTTDKTFHLVKNYRGIRYIHEDRPGLNVARNRALREARGDIVAFCDDDAIPDPEWLHNLLRNFIDPLVLCVTGLTMPLELETEAQEWFERYSTFGRGFRHIVFTRSSINPLAAGKVGAGANMAFRKNILELVGPFDEALDGGTPTRSGGDTEMFSRILSLGYHIAYDPEALNRHRHRRTWEDLRDTLYGYGVGVYAFWTRRLLIEHEFRVFRLAWNWFFRYQLRSLAKSLLRKPHSKPLDLLLAELRGCFAGPRAYLRSRRLLQNKHLLS